MKKLIALLVLFTVAACGGDVQSTLGMRRDAPDEFAVEKRPSLETPPQFKLRPPAPGELPRNVSDMRDEARMKLINSPIVEGAQTSGEEALLGRIGTERANDDIREVIRQEYDEQSDPGVLEKIRKISADNRDKTLVDAQKEKERIEKNLKENKPVTEGETPAKSVNDGKSVIEKILN